MIGRNHSGSPCPTLLLKHVAQGCVHTVLEYFRWGRFHTLPGHPAPVLSHCTGEFFLMSRWNFVGINFCPFLWCHCWAPPSRARSLLCPSLQTLTDRDEGPSQSSLPRGEQAQLPHPFFMNPVLYVIMFDIFPSWLKTVAQSAQRGCGVSVRRGVQILGRCSSEQPRVDPLLGLDNLQKS